MASKVLLTRKNFFLVYYAWESHLRLAIVKPFALSSLQRFMLWRCSDSFEEFHRLIHPSTRHRGTIWSLILHALSTASTARNLIVAFVQFWLPLWNFHGNFHPDGRPGASTTISRQHHLRHKIVEKKKPRVIEKKTRSVTHSLIHRQEYSASLRWCNPS